VGDGAAAWRLTVADARQALSQRVEFSAEAIAALEI